MTDYEKGVRHASDQEANEVYRKGVICTNKIKDNSLQRNEPVGKRTYRGDQLEVVNTVKYIDRMNTAGGEGEEVSC